MSETDASRAADTNTPPTLASSAQAANIPAAYYQKLQVQQLAATTTAARSTLFGQTLTAVPNQGPAVINGKVYVTFCAVGGDCYVAFKFGTATATVTTTTGWLIPQGQERSWWFDTQMLNDVEVITSTGTATLKWYISSPELNKVTGMTF